MQQPVPYAVIQVAPGPPPAIACSWWRRVGEQVATDTLTVGGATLHHAYKIAHFGNAQLRLVFCADCGGTTAGAYSPLLAQPCRHEASATRQMQLARMLMKGIWPTGALQRQQGRAELSAIIAFSPVDDATCRIILQRQGEEQAAQSSK